MSFEVELAGVTLRASSISEALELAGDLVEAAGSGAGLAIRRDGELDEALTELAGESLRPVRLGHGRNVHLGAPPRTS